MSTPKITDDTIRYLKLCGWLGAPGGYLWLDQSTSEWHTVAEARAIQISRDRKEVDHGED